MLPTADAVAGTLENNVNVHTMDTDIPVVLQTKVDVLLDTKAEIAGSREAPGVDLIVVHLESLVKDLKGLRTTNCDVRGNLIVTADAELGDCSMGTGEHGFLASQLLDHTRRAGNLITNRTWVDVDANLGNADITEDVFGGHRKGRPQPSER